MSLKLKVNGSEVAVKSLKFPAGESLVQVDGERFRSPVVSAEIELHFRGNDDLIELALLTDAVRRMYPTLQSVTLKMPYFPYARQDRVCNPGESLSAKVIADLINSLNFTKVHCMDLHSTVSQALINNLQHHDLTEVARYMVRHLPDAILVSPDAGAAKKVFEFAKVHLYRRVIVADKVRDTATGAITDTRILDTAPVPDGADLLIMDDICDGGRTFIELAAKLRQLTNGKIYLYVTHGIFSKGADVFDGLIDGIFTSNLMGAKHPLITEIAA